MVYVQLLLTESSEYAISAVESSVVFPFFLYITRAIFFFVSSSLTLIIPTIFKSAPLNRSRLCLHIRGRWHGYELRATQRDGGGVAPSCSFYSIRFVEDRPALLYLKFYIDFHRKSAPYACGQLTASTVGGAGGRLYKNHDETMYYVIIPCDKSTEPSLTFIIP